MIWESVRYSNYQALIQNWLPRSLSGTESACNARDAGSIPGWGRSLGGGNGNPLQFFCLGNPMDRGAWRLRAHGGLKSMTQLRDQITTPDTKSESLEVRLSNLCSIKPSRRFWSMFKFKKLRCKLRLPSLICKMGFLRPTLQNKGGKQTREKDTLMQWPFILLTSSLKKIFFKVKGPN